MSLRMIISLLFATSVLLQAQTEFPATHTCRMSTGIYSYDRAEGVALFHLDRETRSMRYRVSLSHASSPITTYRFVRHRNDDVGDTLLWLTPVSGRSTEEGTVSNLEASLIDALDAGSLDLEATFDGEYNESVVTGRILEASNVVVRDLAGYWGVPRNDSTDGVGELAGMLNPLDHRLTYRAHWRRLSSQAVELRFVRATAGRNGPIIHTVSVRQGDTAAVGIWEGISVADMNAIQAGGIHAILTTTMYPDGEIRGPLMHQYVFSTFIEPEQVVPPTAGSSARGTGVVTIVYCPDRGVGIDPAYTLSAMAVVHGLADTVESAHIHRGDRGTSPTDWVDDLEKGERGGWHRESGYLWKLDDALRLGRAFIDFHTTPYPDGEIRGQFVPSTTNLPLDVASVPTRRTRDPALIAIQFDRAANLLRIVRCDVDLVRPLDVVLCSADGNVLIAKRIENRRDEISTVDLASGSYLLRSWVAGAEARAIVVHVVK